MKSNIPSAVQKNSVTTGHSWQSKTSIYFTGKFWLSPRVPGKIAKIYHFQNPNNNDHNIRISFTPHKPGDIVPGIVPGDITFRFTNPIRVYI
jgi:hypothetical protein